MEAEGKREFIKIDATRIILIDLREQFHDLRRRQILFQHFQIDKRMNSPENIWNYLQNEIRICKTKLLN